MHAVASFPAREAAEEPRAAAEGPCDEAAELDDPLISAILHSLAAFGLGVAQLSAAAGPPRPQQQQQQPQQQQQQQQQQQRRQQGPESGVGSVLLFQDFCRAQLHSLLLQLLVPSEAPRLNEGAFCNCPYHVPAVQESRRQSHGERQLWGPSHFCLFILFRVFHFCCRLRSSSVLYSAFLLLVCTCSSSSRSSSSSGVGSSSPAAAAAAAAEQDPLLHFLASLWKLCDEADFILKTLNPLESRHWQAAVLKDPNADPSPLGGPPGGPPGGFPFDAAEGPPGGPPAAETYPLDPPDEPTPIAGMAFPNGCGLPYVWGPPGGPQGGPPGGPQGGPPGGPPKGGSPACLLPRGSRKSSSSLRRLLSVNSLSRANSRGGRDRRDLPWGACAAAAAGQTAAAAAAAGCHSCLLLAISRCQCVAYVRGVLAGLLPVLLWSYLTRILLPLQQQPLLHLLLPVLELAASDSSAATDSQQPAAAAAATADAAAAQAKDGPCPASFYPSLRQRLLLQQGGPHYSCCESLGLEGLLLLLAGRQFAAAVLVSFCWGQQLQQVAAEAAAAQPPGAAAVQKWDDPQPTHASPAAAAAAAAAAPPATPAAAAGCWAQCALWAQQQLLLCPDSHMALIAAAFAEAVANPLGFAAVSLEALVPQPVVQPELQEQQQQQQQKQQGGQALEIDALAARLVDSALMQDPWHCSSSSSSSKNSSSSEKQQSEMEGKAQEGPQLPSLSAPGGAAAAAAAAPASSLLSMEELLQLEVDPCQTGRAYFPVGEALLLQLCKTVGALLHLHSSSSSSSRTPCCAIPLGGVAAATSAEADTQQQWQSELLLAQQHDGLVQQQIQTLLQQAAAAAAAAARSSTGNSTVQQQAERSSSNGCVAAAVVPAAALQHQLLLLLLLHQVHHFGCNCCCCSTETTGCIRTSQLLYRTAAAYRSTQPHAGGLQDPLGAPPGAPLGPPLGAPLGAPFGAPKYPLWNLMKQQTVSARLRSAAKSCMHRAEREWLPRSYWAFVALATLK
ncbi:hypothetical protein, conserved [Eimeria tenella]|uniref:Uncharacterized protein n=1 Tax=Eimeria tenella TaxID=5802 RepID=U6KM19_EIMTE|nr:hypothetical protein, conserved [Eimeria tenella]CDJ37836.1 hypothetical protein, conserved [Eimeria tenella]|eukprot:XP_013228674.1 hypothetical protein, conserved [Eimeria tenella]